MHKLNEINHKTQPPPPTLFKKVVLDVSVLTRYMYQTIDTLVQILIIINIM